MTSACAIQSQCQGWVRQMALPLIPEKRVKGALNLISRDSGLSYSKVRKIFYGLTDHILAYERERLRQARERWLARMEMKTAADLETIRRLRRDRDAYELQQDLDL